LAEVAGRAAILVDPQSVSEISKALWSIVSDDALVAELSIQGKHRSEDFSWKVSAEKLLKIFENFTN